MAGDPAAGGERAAVLDLLLVCPDGSSLAQLTALRPWSRRHRRWWVCPPTPEARSVLRGERVRWSLRPLADPLTGSTLVDLAMNVGPAWRAVRQVRPDVVLACGAAAAFPFLGVARLLRIPGVYLEDCDRPDGAGVLDRICRSLADRTVVPWDEQVGLDPDCDVVGCLL